MEENKILQYLRLSEVIIGVFRISEKFNRIDTKFL